MIVSFFLHSARITLPSILPCTLMSLQHMETPTIPHRAKRGEPSQANGQAGSTEETEGQTVGGMQTGGRGKRSVSSLFRFQLHFHVVGRHGAGRRKTGQGRERRSAAMGLPDGALIYTSAPMAVFSFSFPLSLSSAFPSLCLLMC